MLMHAHNGSVDHLDSRITVDTQARRIKTSALLSFPGSMAMQTNTNCAKRKAIHGPIPASVLSLAGHLQPKQVRTA
jgi:hypothetical protein